MSAYELVSYVTVSLYNLHNVHDNYSFVSYNHLPSMHTTQYSYTAYYCSMKCNYIDHEWYAVTLMTVIY